MTALSPSQTNTNFNPGCAAAEEQAERELSAFFGAVTELFGPDEARLSAEDWMDEMNQIESLPASFREWRSITIKAAARLASRVMKTFPSIESQILRRKLCAYLSLELQAS